MAAFRIRLRPREITFEARDRAVEALAETIAHWRAIRRGESWEPFAAAVGTHVAPHYPPPVFRSRAEAEAFALRCIRYDKGRLAALRKALAGRGRQVWMF